MTTIAIVGAGVAGLSCAHALANADVAADVDIFEKSTGLGGRVATRRRNGCVYDYGANYVTETTSAARERLRDVLGVRLVDTPAPVWTFDAGETIEPGDSDDKRKWTYRDGIATLGRRLLDTTDATVLFDTRISDLARVDGDWRLTDAAGDAYGDYDAVVLTPPAPQTAALLDATDWDDPRREAIAAAARDVAYRPIFTAVCHYSFATERPYYALVNTDRNHAVGWLSREEVKPGHVPDGETLLVVQLSPQWTTAHADTDPEAAVSAATDHVASLLGDRYATPDWHDHKRWRHALPERGADREALRPTREAGLWVAGDWVAGDGRVASTLENGVRVGTELAEWTATR